jgi:FkbM family methyltransferase
MPNEQIAEFIPSPVCVARGSAVPSTAEFTMSAKRPPLSASRLGKWLGRRIAEPLNKHRGDYVFLNPPYAAEQAVRSRRSGKRIAYRVRDKNDLSIANQMFAQEEYAIRHFKRGADIEARYRAIVEKGGTPLLLDCGANIGLSALYFHDQFPQARIVAVEPDPDNFAMLQQNVSAAGVIAVQAAVASSARRGRVSDPGTGGCGKRVEDDPNGAVSFLSIDGLVRQYGEGAEPFLLKMDIEGFEQDVFAGGTEWLDAFYVAMIELHDWMLPGAASSRPFLAALAPLDRDFLFRGENVFSVSNRKP